MTLSEAETLHALIGPHGLSDIAQSRGLLVAYRNAVLECYQAAIGELVTLILDTDPSMEPIEAAALARREARCQMCEIHSQAFIEVVCP